MAAYPIGSASIAWGLVSIFVNIYPATSPKCTAINLQHLHCGARVTSQMVCPIHRTVIAPDDVVRGFRVGRGYATRSGPIELVEFVPPGTVDPLYIESTYYLGPDSTSAAAFQLLAHAMRRKDRIAVGRHGAREKDSVVLLRPYKDGLMLHGAYCASEIRHLPDVPMVAFDDPVYVRRTERAIQERLGEAFDPSKYRDGWRDHMLAAAERQRMREEIVPAPEPDVAVILETTAQSERRPSSVPPSGPGPAKARPRSEPPGPDLPKADILRAT